MFRTSLVVLMLVLGAWLADGTDAGGIWDPYGGNAATDAGLAWDPYG